MSDTNGVFDLDVLVHKERHYTYKGRKYTLKPASEGAVILLRTQVSRSPKMTDGKVSADVSRAQETAIILLSMCLTDDAAGRLVSEDELRTWDSAVVGRLLVDAKEISDLADKPKTRPELQKAIAELQKQMDELEDSIGPK